MSRFGNLIRVLGLAASLTTVLGCQAIFGEFTIDDSAFGQVGPILLSPTEGLYTTEWGGQAKFTIVLDKQPTSDVTVAIKSSNEAEGKVAPASVTFTKDDWKAPQVVTVTGQNDTEKDPDHPYTIITEPAVSDDPAFNGKDAIDLKLKNVDNETAGITVVPRAGLVTSEGGGQDTFTVVLNSQPQKDVTIKLVSDTPSEGTVSPESLVFTPANWMAPQLVTVTGVNDDVKDPEHGYKINVSATSDDQNFAHLAVIPVAVVNQDDDSAGLTVALVSGIDPVDSTKLRTSEDQTSATFTVALNLQPTTDVVIPVSSDTPSEGSVSPDTLTFTPDNWNAPQTVTVTGVEDEQTADGDQPYNIVLGVPTAGDADYLALHETKVPAHNVDNDKPGFTLVFLTGLDPKDATNTTLLTSEARTTATFSLALNSKPSAPVTVGITSSMTTEGEVSPESLLFTTDNWNSPHIVSVTGVDDDAQDGSPVYFVRTDPALSDDPGYAMIDPPDVQVTNQDDDSAGVSTVLVNGKDPTNSSKLVTDEWGSSATFTVALTSEPQGDVSIPLTSSNIKEGTVSPATLTFTRANYRAPQTVTITGQNDESFDGNQPFSITVGPATSADDPNYNGKSGVPVQVTNRDDDSAGVIVTPPASGLTTSESGGKDTFTIRLQSKPNDNVSIGIRSSNPAEGKPNVSSVTFTPTNWNANQTITVTGQEDDGAADGSQSYRIILDPASSNGDPNYNGKPDPADVPATNLDNDSASIVVSPVSGLSTSEDGGKATFTIAVTSKPVGANGAAASVKIQLSSSRPTEGSVSPASVTFDGTNWKVPQTVTVTGVDDPVPVADGPQPYVIITSPASSIDPNYNTMNASDVSVTNVDNDSAGIRITPPASTTPAVTTEKAGTATFSVVLNSQPSNDVTFTVTSLDTTEGKVSPATLQFTAANWKVAQVVTVTGVNDDLADGDQQYIVRLSDGASTDPGYSGKFGIDLPFVTLDDDVPGLAVVAPPGLTTTEKNLGTATFTVALTSQPTAGVSIAVSSTDMTEGMVSPTLLSFSTSNWSVPQTVTITGVQDDEADGPQTYQVKLGNASSTDANYAGKFATQLDVQNTDDDQPGFLVSADPMLQTTEKGGQATFNVALKSKPTGGASVTLGLSTSLAKEGTVSPSSLLFTSDDWGKPHQVTVTGIDDKKVDGDAVYYVVFMQPSSADSAYASLAPPASVQLTNLDNGLGIQLKSTSCLTTPGTTATFTIRLNSQPSANVTISLLSNTPTEGSVAPDSVMFTSASGPGGWDTEQTVTVTGGAGTMSMATPYQIITGDASAPTETTGYDGFIVPDVSCTNTAP